MCIFDQGSQTSQQFMAKPIICKKTSLLLNKGEIYVLLQTRFVFELFLFQYDFNLYFSFWIPTVNRSRKIGTITTT